MLDFISFIGRCINFAISDNNLSEKDVRKKIDYHTKMGNMSQANYWRNILMNKKG